MKLAKKRIGLLLLSVTIKLPFSLPRGPLSYVNSKQAQVFYWVVYVSQSINFFCGK